MPQFEEMLAEQAESTSTFGENLVRNGDFSSHHLKANKKSGTTDAFNDGSWEADVGKIEVQRGITKGTPAQKVKTKVLELDARTDKHGLGATESNVEISQTIEAIDGPGTFRLSIDYKAMKGKKGVTAEETSGAEIWLGDKLVATLSSDNKNWHQEVLEITLDPEDIPADGDVKFTLKGTGQADGRGMQIDNVSLREVGETGLLSDELVSNGSFEDHGEFTKKKWGTFDGIPGWELENDSVVELREVRKPIDPRDKSDAYIELDSHGKNSNSTVTQEVDVPEAGKYLLQFDYSARAKKGEIDGTAGVKIMVGDQVVAELSADEVGWDTYTFNIDLPAGPVSLSFEGTGAQDKFGALIDNIEMKRVGEADNLPETEAAAPIQYEYQSGLLGEVFFADEVLKHIDEAVKHIDDTPDATFVATEIDYGHDTGWFHTPLAAMLEHDAVSLEGSDEALNTNVNHTVMELTGEIYLEAGSHTFHNWTDDGFRLTIDGQEVAEYHGLRAARTTEGEISIAEDGWYSIDIDYFEWKGHSKLRIKHEHDGETKTLDESILRHKVEVDNLGPDAIDDGVVEGEENQAITIDALDNDHDPDGDTVFVVDATDGANGTVSFTPPTVTEVENNEEVTLGDNLIVNGDFEDNPLNGRIGWGHWDTIDGWESPVGRIEVQTRDYNTGNERGNAVVELDSHGANSNATLSQEVQVEDEGTYQFSLDYAMRGKHGWTNGVGVKINGEVVYEVERPTEKGFQTITLDVDLDPGTALIEIYALGKQDTIGTVIDNVSLRKMEPGEPTQVLTAPDGGVITYTPNEGFTGEDTFTYTISDGNGGTDTATVTVYVNEGNVAPLAADDQLETAEDTSITADLLENDLDLDGDTLTITEVGAAQNGELVLNDDGTITFTPDENFHGEVSFEYTVTDGELTDTATATIVVTPVNDAPVAMDDQAEMDEDTSITLNLVGNDRDVDGDDLSISALGTVSGGTLTETADGRVTFTPDENFFGEVTFTYDVTDGELTDTGTVTITVNEVNDGPTALDDQGAGVAGQAIVIDLLRNDFDADGDEIQITNFSGVNGATVVDNGDGTVTFTSDLEAEGQLMFDYTISDGNGGVDSATVSVAVEAANSAPEARNDIVEMDENTSVVLDILGNDFDPDGDDLSILEMGSVQNGSVEMNDDGTVTFTPDEGFYGEAGFMYQVTDGDLTDMATVSITVVSTNLAPIAETDTVTLDEDTSATFNVLDNDVDPDGDAIVLTAVSAPDSGTVDFLEDGTVTYTPAADYFGSFSLNYWIEDLEGARTTGTVDIEVLPVNDAPIARADDVSINRDSSVFANVLQNDMDPDGEEITLVSATAERGEVSIIDGEVFFDPGSDFDSIELGTSEDEIVTYTIRDASGMEATGTLTVTVDAPFSARVIEELDFILKGANGKSATPDGEVADQLIEDQVLTGDDNRDELAFDVRSTGGNGRVGDDGERGANNNTGDAGHGTDGSVGGSGADGIATFVDGEIQGLESDDVMDISVEANGGRGGTGGSGGNGGRSNPLGTEEVVSASGVSTVTDYDGGLGGDGANGADGNDGGIAWSTLEGGLYDGGDGADQIHFVIDAFGGDGGAGGAGGRAGNGAAELPDSDAQSNPAIAGDGGFGGNGGDATAEMLGADIKGGEGADSVVIEVTASAGDGGTGGDGGNASYTWYRDTLREVQSDGSADEVSGYIERHYGAAGDGVDAGDAGNAIARIMDLIVQADLGDDEITLDATAFAHDAPQAGDAGNPGSDLYETEAETGATENRYFSGTEGDDGVDGLGGNARVEILDNLLDGGEGNDTVILMADVSAGGTAELILTGNTVDGGEGIDTLDLSGIGTAVNVDLSAGTFGTSDNAGANTVISIEMVTGGSLADVLAGSSNDETIAGGEGNDELSGGGGLDTFVFENNAGQDTISDFSNDLLDVSAIASVRDMTDVTITQSGSDATVTLDSGDIIVLEGITATTLDDSHFVF